ncbi:MAG: SpoIVB peptidase [Candidatus Metalachnospira sp.]|nr:SpoIVB peptidase [Candidatus Metalachnospira sp.]
MFLPIFAIALTVIFSSSANTNENVNTNEGQVTSASAVFSESEEKMLIPGGSVIGVTLESNGILVLGTGNVTGQDRHVYSPAEKILKEGDIILKADGVELNDKEALLKVVKNSSEDVTLTVFRDNEVIDVNVTPIKCIEDGSRKIGVWVRDSTQGIGTLTYIDPDDLSFGALGHGVYDADTGELMSLKSGNLVGSTLTGIRKSEKGIPGELSGVLNKSVIFGNVNANTECGIYGTVSSDATKALYSDPIPVANIDEIKTGEASVLCSLDGKEVKEYKIMIEGINADASEADKGLVIRITDEELKNATGGIVQGMSGSPIIQNGKLIGAVTHVFVREPTKGYGIFAVSMLNEDEKVNG